MRSQYKKEYTDYINSQKWKQKRKLIIERCGNKCEGCGLKNVEEVHHVTYKNFGDEFLFELIGLCKQCHVNIHKYDKKLINPYKILEIKEKEKIEDVEKRKSSIVIRLKKLKEIIDK